MGRKPVAIETPSGVLTKVNSDGVVYRHYIITQHALERFQERSGLSLDYMLVTLDRAVLAEASRAKDHRIQNQIRKSERIGGYALLDPETNVYFFLVVGPKFHTICTVMTKEVMTYAS